MEQLNREDEEDSSEINTYLASFNKEIEPGEAEEPNSTLEEDSEEEANSANEIYPYLSENELDEEESLIQIKEEPEDEPEYYTDLDSNSENIQKASDKESLNISHMQSNGVSELLAVANGEVTVIPSVDGDLDDQQALEMVAKFAEQAVANASKTNVSGLEDGNSYQTVTIVPSDTNPGELSYVVFVSQEGDDLNQTGNDEVVYDFENPSRLRKKLLSKQVDVSKQLTMKLSRKYQMMTTQHMCSYCDYTSPKRYLLSRHMKSHSDERPHKCGVCERGFKTLASLQNHVNTHTGTRPHPCKECESCFTTSGELVRHVRYKHTHEKPHKCTECDYASVELSKLKRHMRCHTGERPYQCPHCTYASPDTYKLKRHLRIHTGEKPYECDVCQTRFTQSNSLKAHKLIHSGNKPIFQCEYCPTTCGRKTDLRIHMEKLHSSDNPHRCKRCGKVFLDRYSYKIHVKSHDGEKCFKCDLCDYASISHRHLETHMLVHTDQKPFHCDECDLSFRQKQLLKRHKNLYHDPNYVKPEPKEKTHICAICFKAFRHKGNLIRHYAIHDPEASYSDKEDALRLGEPKEPGEVRDGEEEDDEEDNLKESADKDDDQIVVFEVIQLPPTNGVYSENQEVTMVDGSALGVENEDYSIIQSVDDEENGLYGFSNPDDFEDLENISTSSKATKRRGYQTSGKTNGLRKKKNTLITQKRKASTVKNPKVLKVTPAKTSNVNNILYLNDDLLDNEEDSVVREQIDKDFKDCFGFDEKDDDILNPVVFSETLDVIS